MNILILAEHIAPHPWSESRWAADLAAALAARGHAVTLACDSMHDEAAAHPAAVFARRFRKRERDRRPLGFARWARRLRRTHPHDVSLSLSRLVPADARLVVGPSTVESFRAAVRSRTLLSALFEIVQHPHLPGAVFAERLAAAPGRQRTLRLGGLPGEAGPDHLGYASRLTPPDPAAFDDLRRRTRETLGLAPERPAILISAVHHDRAGLDPMLEALNAVRQARREHAPVLLIAGGPSLALRNTGPGAEAFRFLGSTSRIDAALAACDLAAAPLGGSREGDTGRFIADALRLGRPVLAPGHVRGAELLAPLRVPGHGGTSPGQVIARPDASHWRRALHGAMSERWRAEASHAASIVGRDLSMEALAARLERALADARPR